MRGLLTFLIWIAGQSLLFSCLDAILAQRPYVFLLAHDLARTGHSNRRQPEDMTWRASRACRFYPLRL
jgi:hypothetical protein